MTADSKVLVKWLPGLTALYLSHISPEATRWTVYRQSAIVLTVAEACKVINQIEQPAMMVVL